MQAPRLEHPDVVARRVRGPRCPHVPVPLDAEPVPQPEGLALVVGAEERAAPADAGHVGGAEEQDRTAWSARAHHAPAADERPADEDRIHPRRAAVLGAQHRRAAAHDEQVGVREVRGLEGHHVVEAAEGAVGERRPVLAVGRPAPQSAERGADVERALSARRSDSRAPRVPRLVPRAHLFPEPRRGASGRAASLEGAARILGERVARQPLRAPVLLLDGAPVDAGGRAVHLLEPLRAGLSIGVVVLAFSLAEREAPRIGGGGPLLVRRRGSR